MPLRVSMLIGARWHTAQHLNLRAMGVLSHAPVLLPPAPHLCRYSHGGSELRGTGDYFVVTGLLALGCVPTVWGCAIAAFDYEFIEAGRFGLIWFVQK